MSETMNADDFCAFMMPYFSPMAFFGFGDDANGFYFVFGWLKVWSGMIRIIFSSFVLLALVLTNHVVFF